jgi:hypothetical protein
LIGEEHWLLVDDLLLAGDLKCLFLVAPCSCATDSAAVAIEFDVAAASVKMVQLRLVFVRVNQGLHFFQIDVVERRQQERMRSFPVLLVSKTSTRPIARECLFHSLPCATFRLSTYSNLASNRLVLSVL